MRIASFILLIVFIGLVFICLAGCISYIIYKFETPALAIVLGVAALGGLIISIGAASRRIV